jgi:phosphatidylglycerophosphate synthase
MTHESHVRSESPNPGRPVPPVTKVEQSPFDPLVKRIFPRIEARVPVGVTANQVTLLGHLASLLAAMCLWLSPGSRWLCVAAAALLFVHWFTDTLDGPMARARGASDLGHYLDHYGDVLGSVVVTLAVFQTPGSHTSIGVALVVIYLLWMVHTLIRAEITGITVIPPFGPTELHFVTIVALVTQVFVDYGRPLSWLGTLTAEGGMLPRLLGFDSGLTLVDTVGLLLLAGGCIGLAIEVPAFVSALRRRR